MIPSTDNITRNSNAMTKLLFQSLAVAVAVLVICGGGSPPDGGGGALAFVLSSPSLPPKQQMPTTPTNAVLRMAGIHEPSASLKADENFIKRELLFRQVVKEVNMVGEYLDWLVATSSPSSSVVEGSDAAAGNVEAATTTSGDDNAVELLGGSGGRDSMGPSIIATGDKPPDKPSTQYKPALRTNLGSTILLSGSDILDSTLLSILNNNFFGIEDVPNFHFNAIRAIVPNVGAAKKMAIGREARYGGLLDKLVIEPLSETTAERLPSPTQLEGASSWIVQLTSSTVHLLPQIATLAKNAAMLKHLIVMIVARDVDGCSKCKIGWESILESSNDGTNFAATLLAMDEIYVAQGDTMQRETGYYHIDPIIFDDGSSSASSSSTTSSSTTVTTTTPPTPVRRMSARNAYRILGHALALDCTVQKALSVYEYNPTEVECLTTPMAVGEFALRDEVTGNEIPDVYGDVKMDGRMIQAMREVGFTPVMELYFLFDMGIELSYLYIFVLHVSPPPHFLLGFTTCTYCKRRCHGKGVMGRMGGGERKRYIFIRNIFLTHHLILFTSRNYIHHTGIQGVHCQPTRQGECFWFFLLQQ